MSNETPTATCIRCENPMSQCTCGPGAFDRTMGIPAQPDAPGDAAPESGERHPATEDESKEFSDNLERRYNVFQDRQAQRHLAGKRVIPGGVLVFNSLVIMQDAVTEFTHHLSQVLKIPPALISVKTSPGKIRGTLTPEVDIGVPSTFFHRIQAEHPHQRLTDAQIKTEVDTRVQVAIKSCGEIFKANYTARMGAYFGTPSILLAGPGDIPRA